MQTLLPLEFLPDYKAYEYLYTAELAEAGWQYYMLNLLFWCAKVVGIEYDTFRLFCTFIFAYIFGKKTVELGNIWVYIFAFIFVFEFVVIRFRAGLLFTLLLLVSNRFRLFAYPLHFSTGLYTVMFAILKDNANRMITIGISLIVLISVVISSNYRIDFLSELNPVRAFTMIILPAIFAVIYYKKHFTYLVLFGLFSIGYYLGLLDKSGEVLVRVLGVYIFTQIYLLRKLNLINVYLFVMNSLFFINTLFAVK